jgi:protein NRD1
MVSAEYGGTGGKPIEEGLVVEEPDIEIGAGVSSKGICFLIMTLSTLKLTIGQQ